MKVGTRASLAVVLPEPLVAPPPKMKVAKAANGMSAVCPVTTPVAVSVPARDLPFRGYDPCSAMINPYLTRRARMNPEAVLVLTVNTDKPTRNTVVELATLILTVGVWNI